MDELDLKTAKIVSCINALIEEAVNHGGDSGGPWLTNESDLVSSINDLCTELGIKDYKIKTKDENGFECIPQVILG